LHIKVLFFSVNISDIQSFLMYLWV